MLTRAWLIGFATTLLFLTGCGGPTMAPVKGRITCKGKPVYQASVIFNPEPTHEKDREPGKAGSGFTEKDGTYSISTYRNYDGAQVGKHKVTVSLDDSNPARCARMKHFYLEVAPGSNELNIELDDNTK